MVQEISACGSCEGRQDGTYFVEAVELELGLESLLGFEKERVSGREKGVERAREQRQDWWAHAGRDRCD